MSARKMMFVSILMSWLMILTLNALGTSASIQDPVVKPTMVPVVPGGPDSTIRFTVKVTHPDYEVVAVKGGYFTDGTWGQGLLIQSNDAVKGEDGETWITTLPVQAGISDGVKTMYVYCRLSNGVGYWSTQGPCGTFTVLIQNSVVEPVTIPVAYKSALRFTVKVTHPDYEVVAVKGGYFTDGTWGQGLLIQSDDAVKGEDGETWTATLPVQADVPIGTKNVYVYRRLSNGVGYWSTQAPCETFTIFRPTSEEYLNIFNNRLVDTESLRQTLTNMKSFLPVGVVYWACATVPPWSRTPPEQMRQELEDIKDHGNNSIAVYGAGDIADRIQLLQIAEEVGLKVMLFDDNIFQLIYNAQSQITEESLMPYASESVNALSGYTSLLGYYIYDEPILAKCDNVGVASRVYEKLDPYHISSPVNNLSGAHRGPLMDRQDRIGSMVFWYDNYQPLISDDNEDPLLAAMSVGVDEAHEVAKTYFIPLWVMLSAKNEVGFDRQARSLRARVYIALAHGAKGIWYFPYQTTPTQQGLINLDGSATPAWDEFNVLGQELQTLSPLILKLNRVENIAVAQLPIDAETLEHKDDASIYLIVTNLDIDGEQEANILIDEEQSFIKGTDVLSGEEFPISQGVLDLSMMSPGEGLVLKLE